MTPEELKEKIDGLKDSAITRLRDELSPFVASISSREAFSPVAKHFGTGSFCRWKDRVFLLSNAHVLGREDLTLGVALKSGAEMHTLSGDVPQSEDSDLALMEIPLDAWERGDRLAVAGSFFGPHRVPDGEYCFFMGFPKGTSFTSVAERAVRTRVLPYAGQKLPGLTDDWVFYIDVNFDRMRDVEGNPVEPFDFEGVSGSLVWDTGIVACAQSGAEWRPQLVRPVGVVRAWQEKLGRLEVVRGEHIADLLRRGIHKMDEEAAAEASQPTDE
jgi:hypothetical protein